MQYRHAAVPPLPRRQFLHACGRAAAAAAVAPALLPGCRSLGARGSESRFRGAAVEAPVAIATWQHGSPAVDEAYRTLEQGGAPLDAVERGINLVELDPKVSTVGVGGRPNEAGVVQLDAGIMDGASLRCGSVLAIEDIDRPISVARRVMERTRHVQLVGAGARQFALAQGFEPKDLLTDDSRRAWEAWRASSDRRVPGQVDPPASSPGAAESQHDTIGMVVLDATGRMAAGCSTSGLAWKMPGRVGDSPIIGAGLYCDGSVGGASATGIGEEVLRVCGSFLIVEAMRHGASPQEAVETALRRIVEVDPKNRRRQVAFIALSHRGEIGAGSIQPGFGIAIRSPAGGSIRQTWSLEKPIPAGGAA